MVLIGAILLGLLGLCGGIHRRVLSSARRDMAEARECVHVILQCSFVYSPLTTDQFSGVFLESAQELERVCKQNKNFIECVENAEEFCEDRNIEMVEAVMIENRLWTRDLCTENSEWKKWYLKYGPCINKQFPLATERCNLQFPIPSADAGMAGMCKYLDGLMDCKANILNNRCSENAAELYRRIALLNGGREYLCSGRQTSRDEVSPALIAAQMLNTVRTLMKNMSDIFRESMGPELATEVLQEIDPRDPDLQNPFDIDMEEFVSMLKGNIPKDVVDMLRDKEDGFVKPLFDFDEVLVENDNDFVEDSLEARLQMPQNTVYHFEQFEGNDYTEQYDEEDISKGLFESSSSQILMKDDLYSVLSDVTENTNEVKLQNEQISEEEIGDSPIDQLSCKIFNGLEIPFSKNNATFKVYGISNLGQKNHLGSGQTLLQWKTFQNIPLDDLYCSWMDQGSSSILFRCALKLTELTTLPQQKSPTAPVRLSLYTATSTFQQSEEITLSKLANICLENYQSSKDISIEAEDSIYTPKSILREYMHDHDIHRSGELLIEDPSNEIEDKTSKFETFDENLEGSYLHDNPETYYDGSIELNAKEISQEESESGISVTMDSNISHISEDYEIPEILNDVDDELGSLYDANDKSSNFNNGDLYNSKSDEVAIEDSPDFVSSDYVSSEPQTCQSKSYSECPKPDPRDDPPENHKSTRSYGIRPGMYFDARNIEIVDPLNGSVMRGDVETSSIEDINYVVVGNPFIPSDASTEDSGEEHFSDFNANILGQLEAKRVIEEEIENIYAEQVEEIS